MFYGWFKKHRTPYPNLITTRLPSAQGLLIASFLLYAIAFGTSEAYRTQSKSMRSRLFPGIILPYENVSACRGAPTCALYQGDVRPLSR
ncbi:hypothetical protein [Coleofasciculus chthonoplastes]|uniref:hypothetical protein n=1 Tax=Coleofasciculus chthonoplastes TaxID=64178 RepID=UPI0032FC236B